eukprot:1420773-Karenia_brevis.AAC.1
MARAGCRSHSPVVVRVGSPVNCGPCQLWPMRKLRWTMPPWGFMDIRACQGAPWSTNNKWR